jgi:hypothetical protein
MSDYVPLGEPQTGVNRVATSPTIVALFENVRAVMRGLGSLRPRLHVRAFEDLAKGDSTRYEDNAVYETTSPDFVLIGRFAFQQSGSVRITIQQLGIDGGTSRVRVRYNNATIGDWSRSGSSIVRSVDIDNLVRGQNLFIEHLRSNSSGAGRVNQIRFRTTGMNILPAIYGYNYADNSE